MHSTITLATPRRDKPSRELRLRVMLPLFMSTHDFMSPHEALTRQALPRSSDVHSEVCPIGILNSTPSITFLALGPFEKGRRRI